MKNKKSENVRKTVYRRENRNKTHKIRSNEPETESAYLQFDLDFEFNIENIRKMSTENL